MYDLIILGAGPAGLSASIYAVRYKMHHLVIGNVFESSIAKAKEVENWPGEKSISGQNLILKFYEHAKSIGSKIAQESIIDIESSLLKTYGSNNSIKRKNLQNEKKYISSGENKNLFIVKTNSGKIYKSKVILIALGAKHRKLNITGEEKFLGKGVSYCAVCDAAFFKNKIVGVVGGGNSAAMAAMLAAEHAKKVYIIHKRDYLSCYPSFIEKIEKNQKIIVIYNANISKISGNNKVEFIEIDRKYNGKNIIELNGLFIEIGQTPYIKLVEKLKVKTDEQNYIIVDNRCSTNIEGVYAAGDITNGSNKIHQIVTAVSEGVIAVTSAYNYLKER